MHMNPPTKSVRKIGYEPILLPIMGETGVAKVMAKENELMPESPQGDSAEEKPLTPIQEEQG